MTQTADSLRQEAEHEVRELQLDRDVRDAAKAGSSDGGANWYNKIDTGAGMLEIHATFGAGTNTASVLDSARGIRIYEASDYGKHLRAYRRGAWVEVVRAVAQAHRDSVAATDLVRSVDAERSEADRFTPLGES